MADIRMPEMGEGVTTATVAEWLVAPGEQFAAGTVLVEVMTDKAAVEVEATEAGRLTEILVGPEQEVRIGAVLGRYAQE
jgi:pyruvate/2-oxoglutarate dehydrogenase complex dihydrolipoamide acyltransferase (E2) component